MLILLSPAKRLDFETGHRVARATQPRFLDASTRLVEHMREKSANDLRKLMGISEAVARLNVERFEAWSGQVTKANGKQAILAFMGDVYRAFDAPSLDARSLAYVQNHVRILSGLYGLLRPLDLIEPYRLEMGVSLGVQERALASNSPNSPNSISESNLYKFWGSRITDAIAADLGDKSGQMVVNLASDEYAGAVDFSRLNARVVHPKFREWRKGAYQFVSFNAKRARGHMARFLIDERVNSYRALTQFRGDNYAFNAALSMRYRPMFTRDSAAS